MRISYFRNRCLRLEIRNTHYVLVLYIHPLAFFRRLRNRVHDDIVLVAVLEGRAVGGDIRVVDNGIQQVMDLVDEGVLPADDVAVRPPMLPEGVIRLGDEDIGKAGWMACGWLPGR